LPREILDLSLVLLVHENLRRRLGRGILPTTGGGDGGGDGGGSSRQAAADASSPPRPAPPPPPPVDVLTALEAADALPAALFVFSAASSEGGGGDQQPEGGGLAYANAAARELLLAAAAAAAAAAAGGSSSSSNGGSSSSSSSGGPPHPRPLPPAALLQALPRVSEDAACAELRDARWHVPSSAAAAVVFPRALACPVSAPSGEPVGRALLAGAWAFSPAGEAYVGRPGWPRVARRDLPTAEDARAAAEAVRAQADRVRALKTAAALAAAAEGGGDDDPHRSRGSPANRDPAVLEAVAVLGRLKAQLSEAEAVRAAFFGGGGGSSEGGGGGEGEAAVGGPLMADLLRRVG
jgi:hypothetical protein